MKKYFSAIIQHLSNFIRSIFALFGVNETLFLLGIASLFRGVMRLWSFDHALLVCGALLVVVAVGGVITQTRRSPA